MTLHFLCHKLVFLISPAPDSSSHQLGYPLLSPSSLGRKPTDHCASIRAGGPHLRYWMTHLGPASLPSALSHAQGLRLGLRPTAPRHSLSPTSATAHMQWMHSLQLQTLHALAEVWDPTPHVLCEAHFMSITCACVTVTVPVGTGMQAQPQGQDDPAALRAQHWLLSTSPPAVPQSEPHLPADQSHSREAAEPPGRPETSCSLPGKEWSFWKLPHRREEAYFSETHPPAPKARQLPAHPVRARPETSKQLPPRGPGCTAVGPGGGDAVDAPVGCSQTERREDRAGGDPRSCVLPSWSWQLHVHLPWAALPLLRAPVAQQPPDPPLTSSS